MNVLITGGAGFIGSHIAESLIAKGQTVTVLDDLSTGRMANIDHLRDYKKFKFCLGSILDCKLMAKLIKKSDMIYHMAAAVGVKYIIDNPMDSLNVNVKGTEIVLEYANKYGKKKVLLASTSEIYGKNRPGMKSFKETDDRLLGTTSITRWGYSCSKALDEFFALAYYREKKLPVVIVRYFNTCGPRQTGRYGMVVPRFVKQALTGKPLTVFGDGKQTRCFTHVNDTVKATIALVENRKANGEIFNVGNPESISINELALKVKRLTGSRSELLHIPYSKAYEHGFEDMRHRKPNITKIRKLLSFKPKFRINDILKDVIDYNKR